MRVARANIHKNFSEVIFSIALRNSPESIIPIIALNKLRVTCGCELFHKFRILFKLGFNHRAHSVYPRIIPISAKLDLPTKFSGIFATKICELFAIFWIFNFLSLESCFCVSISNAIYSNRRFKKVTQETIVATETIDRWSFFAFLLHFRLHSLLDCGGESGFFLMRLANLASFFLFFPLLLRELFKIRKNCLNSISLESKHLATINPI